MRQLVVVVVAVVAGVWLVVARRPDPLEAVPAPATEDPVVAGDRGVVLEDHRRAPVVVVVAVVDHRARHVDRAANDVAVAAAVPVVADDDVAAAVAVVADDDVAVAAPVVAHDDGVAAVAVVADDDAAAVAMVADNDAAAVATVLIAAPVVAAMAAVGESSATREAKCESGER